MLRIFYPNGKKRLDEVALAPFSQVVPEIHPLFQPYISMPLSLCSSCSLYLRYPPHPAPTFCLAICCWSLDLAQASPLWEAPLGQPFPVPPPG